MQIPTLRCKDVWVIAMLKLNWMLTKRGFKHIAHTCSKDTWARGDQVITRLRLTGRTVVITENIPNMCKLYELPEDSRVLVDLIRRHL